MAARAGPWPPRPERPGAASAGVSLGHENRGSTAPVNSSPGLKVVFRRLQEKARRRRAPGAAGR